MSGSRTMQSVLRGEEVTAADIVALVGVITGVMIDTAMFYLSPEREENKHAIDTRH